MTMTKPLPVKLFFWVRGNKHIQYLAVNHRWVFCPTLEIARNYARKHGYDGIKIQPI